ncbi:serine/Arginine-related protein 53 isoform X5 [Monodelphis domestica]|uniref:serine/Arginine-related protein 53 isoform X5 n=1 Tax=Monodelphis domestica TaxID=13616 RepID=UPI0024E222B5|nr:serine/Arginine-related protein 53 isoform X5 [Monodelphis domestica]
MGRRSSDTEEESRSKRKKKHRRRSSSSSSSESRTFSRKKTGRKSRSKSRSWSRDLQPRSHSYDRRSRSRPRPRSHSRSSERSGHRRTRSRSRERDRRKGREKEKREKERERGKEKELHNTKRGDSGNIKAGLEHLPPAEQAKARLQLVLEAADQATLVEQVKRVKEIEAIESDCFVQQTFRSSKEVRKPTDPGEGKQEPPTLGMVLTDPPHLEKEPEPGSIPTAIKYQDDNSLAHPNLFIDKAEAEEKWFKRLIALRQERLMGSPVA